MKTKRNPAYYAAAAFLAALLTGLLLGSCSLDNSCTAIMEEACAAAEPVTLTVTWNGTSKEDLTFVIDGIPYELTGIPTVSDPVYRLEAADDSMAEVYLQLAYDEAEVCELHMIPEEGNELVFTCEREEMDSFYAWVRSN